MKKISFVVTLVFGVMMALMPGAAWAAVGDGSACVGQGGGGSTSTTKCVWSCASSVTYTHVLYDSGAIENDCQNSDLGSQMQCCSKAQTATAPTVTPPASDGFCTVGGGQCQSVDCAQIGQVDVLSDPGMNDCSAGSRHCCADPDVPVASNGTEIKSFCTGSITKLGGVCRGSANDVCPDNLPAQDTSSTCSVTGICCVNDTAQQGGNTNFTRNGQTCAAHGGSGCDDVIETGFELALADADDFNDCPVDRPHCVKMTAGAVAPDPVMPSEVGFCTGDVYATEGTCLGSLNACPSGTNTDVSGSCTVTGLCCDAPTAAAPAGSVAPVIAAARTGAPGAACTAVVKSQTLSGNCIGAGAYTTSTCATGKDYANVVGGSTCTSGACCVARATYSAAVAGTAAGTTTPSGSTGTSWIPIPTNTGLSQMSPWALLSNILKFLLYMIGTVALLSFVYAGFMYVFAGGDDTKASEAKKIIIYSIAGIVVALVSFILVGTITKLISGTLTTPTPAPAATTTNPSVTNPTTPTTPTTVKPSLGQACTLPSGAAGTCISTTCGSDHESSALACSGLAVQCCSTAASAANTPSSNGSVSNPSGGFDPFGTSGSLGG